MEHPSQFTSSATKLPGLGPLLTFTAVQSHDILCKMSPDILYTPARAQPARGNSGSGRDVFLFDETRNWKRSVACNRKT